MHQTWLRNTKRDLEGAIESAAEAIDEITEDIAEDVKNERKLCKNRLYALKLVLGHAPSANPEHDKPGDDSKLLPGMVIGADGGKLPKDGEKKPADEAAEGKEKGNEGSEAAAEKEKGTEGSEAASEKNEGDGGQKKAAAVKEEDGAGKGEKQKAEEVTAAGADEASTVANFVAKAGDPARALRRYIASFSTNQDKPDFAPPGRSFRALICFCEFESYLDKLEVCDSREDVSSLQAQMKPFKAAYTDLVAMCRAAVTRLRNAVVDARKELQAQSIMGEKAAASAKKHGRPPTKKGSKVAWGPLVDNPEAVCSSCERDRQRGQDVGH